MARERILPGSYPGGIDEAISWILQENLEETSEDAPAELRPRPSKLRRLPKPSPATCPCGCHDYTGEASHCPNCGEPLYH